MEIKVSPFSGKSISEGCNILYLYLRKLTKNPNKEIQASYKSKDWVYWCVGIYEIIMVAVILESIFTEHENLTIILLDIAFFFYLGYLFLVNFFAKRKLRIRMSEVATRDITITFTKNGMDLVREDENVTISWKDIRMVALNPNSILFLPTEPTKKSLLIPSTYKEDVLKALKKVEKEEIVQDYTK